MPETTKREERREREAETIRYVQRVSREAEGAELREAEADRRFGRVVGALLNGEAAEICIRCWFRKSRHPDMEADPIGTAEVGKHSGEPCAHFTPLTPDAWRERNG
jgi:hypothetical protein